MKRSLPGLVGCCAVFGLSIASPAWAVTVDRVMAVVDREVILQSEVMQLVGPYLADLRTQSGNSQEFNDRAEQLTKQALEQAIQDKLLLREALLAGITVEDKDVETRLDEVRKMYPTNEEFLKDLQDSGENMNDLRERLRKQVLARKMAITRLKQLEDGIVVTESDVAQYYQDHQSEFSHPERVYVRQIFMPAGDDASERETVKARMEELKAELDSGSDFAELAKAYSKAPGAEAGGLIGWQERGDLVDALDQAAFALGEGEMSAVVESPGGFHILKVDKKEGAGQSTLDEVRKDIEPLLRRKAATEKFDKWIQELRKRSKVQVFL